jgi:hypothetical protein
MVTRYFEAVRNSVRYKDRPLKRFFAREVAVGFCGMLNIYSLKMTDVDGIFM